MIALFAHSPTRIAAHGDDFSNKSWGSLRLCLRDEYNGERGKPLHARRPTCFARKVRHKPTAGSKAAVQLIPEATVGEKIFLGVAVSRKLPSSTAS
jgi:hypothetical protein